MHSAFLIFFHYLKIFLSSSNIIFKNFSILVISFVQNSERSEFDHKNYHFGSARPLLISGPGFTFWSKVTAVGESWPGLTRPKFELTI